ncbi:hypothetical protein ACW9HQ_39675, partial [Nocardia gipuzkoensis]
GADRGSDAEFAAAVLPALGAAVREFDELLSESGVPLSAPDGKPYAFVRLSPRLAGRSAEEMAPVDGGPPVGNQRYDSGSVVHGTRHSTGNQRTGTFSYDGSRSVDVGFLRRIAIIGQLKLTFNQLSAGSTVDEIVRVVTKVRSLGPAELYDLLGTWQIRSSSGWADLFRVLTDGWETVHVDAPLRVHSPRYLTGSGQTPVIDPSDAATIPAPIERLQHEFPLFGVLGIPDMDRIRADVRASFQMYLRDMDDTSRVALADFLRERLFRAELSRSWSNSGP